VEQMGVRMDLERDEMWEQFPARIELWKHMLTSPTPLSDRQLL
jgi:hypothetical protein